MEISDRELLEMVRDVDESHHESLERFTAGARELHHAAARSARPGRAVSLGAVTIAGAAVGLKEAAAASDDAALSAFAASVELAAVAAYTKGAAALSGVVLTVAKTFASHHQDHANAFNAAAGSKAVTAPNPKLSTSLAAALDAAKTENDVLNLAYGLENKVAATYEFALENLVGTAALQLTASILPVESQHAVVLGTIVGKGPKDVIPASFQGKDGFIDPAQYPPSS